MPSKASRMYSSSTSIADESSAAGASAEASDRPAMVRSSSSSSSGSEVAVFLGTRLVGTPGLANSEKRGRAAPEAGARRETGGLFSSLTSRSGEEAHVGHAFGRVVESSTAAEPKMDATSWAS